MKHVIAFIAVVCGVALLFLTVGCKVKSSAKNQGQDENQSVEEYDPDFQDGKRSLDENDQQDRSSRGIEVVSSMNQYALLIGVNEYAKPIKSLQYCVKDMELLADCFQKVGVPKENIFLVTDNSSADRRPTGINIRRQIENVTRIMGRNDQLIIAFSGHGVQLDDKSYLCPSDTDLKDKNSVVSRDWVFEQLEKCKARQKVFIVDACRNEITFGGGKALGQVRTLEDPIGADTHGFILIASCDKTQQSWEHPEIQHGVFTYFLVEGLSGAAKDEDGYVTVLNLFQYASAKTKKYVLREFNEIQVPTFRQSGEMTDFCLAKVDDSQPIPVSPAPTPVEEPQPPVAPVSVQTTPELPKAGERQVKIVNGVEFAFRWCPPGKFKMGDDKHEVTLTKGFWMMETEVTQKQWKAVMGSNPSKFKGDDLPVETVLWNDCQDFCEECTQFGLPVQLPTEAQWEYACRAGTTGAYAGSLNDMAWYNEKDNGNTHDNGFVQRSIMTNEDFEDFRNRTTHPVGTKKPNAWGLYDMHGNVNEWCQDWYGSYSSGSVTDPTGPSSGSHHVYRGGDYNDSAKCCRSDYRSYDSVNIRNSRYSRLGFNSDMGFRCVLGQ